MPKRLSRRYIAVLLAVTMLLIPSLASACSVCMGAADDQIVIGVNMAVFMLLGVTGTMLSSIAAFMLHLRRRAQKFSLMQKDEQSNSGA